MTSPSSGKINSLVGGLIYNPELAEKLGSFYENLTIEQAQALNKLIWQVWRREIPLDIFLAEATKFNLPSFKEKIFPGILRFDFLPIADYLDININDWLKYLPEKERSGLKTFNLSVWLEQYLKENHLELNEIERKRLEGILGNYLGGRKSEEEAKEFLARTEKLGGLGLDLAEAKAVIATFKEMIEKAWQEDEIITAQEVVERESLNSLNVKFVKKATVETQNFASVQKFVSPIQLLDQTAEDLIKKSGLNIAPELRQRFKIIIISRLKDVRKIPEMRERLIAAPAVGGVGLKLEEAERVVKMVEEAREENLKSQISNLKSEIKISKLEKEAPSPVQQQPKKPVPVIPAETGIQTPPLPASSVLPKPAAPKPPAVEPFRPQPTTTPPKISNISPYGGSRLSSGQYPISSSDIKPLIPSTVKIVPQEKKLPKVELVPTPPPLPKPALTVAIPQTPAGRSQVADVLYKPRLVGPLEELKEMTLLDFRRLSPQPKVTTDKVYAKIELLAEHGYEKKIQGIKAWQGSPVNIIYLEILNESIGKALPVAKIIEERKTSSKETLSKEEFQAIMDLNRRLRF